MMDFTNRFSTTVSNMLGEITRAGFDVTAAGNVVHVKLHTYRDVERYDAVNIFLSDNGVCIRVVGNSYLNYRSRRILNVLYNIIMSGWNPRVMRGHYH